MHQQHEHSEGTASPPPGADTSTMQFLRGKLLRQPFIKTQLLRGGLSAVEIPNSFEAPAVPETDEAGC